jgi:branched-subunit amino acid transport protein
MNIWLMIVLSAFATFLPRVVPYYAKFLRKLPRFARKCILVMPVAALGALLFPGTIVDFSPQWYAGLLGVAVAAALAWWKGTIVLPIIGSVLATWFALTCF